MHYRSKTLWIFAAVATLCAASSAANAQANFWGSSYYYNGHVSGPPVGFGGAYGAAGFGGAYGAAGYGGAYDAYGPIGRRTVEHSGTSVPYDPDGPGWNDFQLQGAN
jgi:hypothetical protein